MDKPNLPTPIAHYFELDKSQAFARAEECFAADAVVRDEKHDIEGVAAIVSWKRESHRKYNYTSEPLRIETIDGKYRVVAKVSGQFPGSPLNLTYEFSLDNNKISYLEIC
jgi:hypothetical protein